MVRLGLRKSSFKFFFLSCILVHAVQAQRQMEFLNRGFVALQTEGGVYLGWRILATDSPATEFVLYKKSGNENREKLLVKQELNNFLDESVDSEPAIYTLGVLKNGQEKLIDSISFTPVAPGKEIKNYFSIPLRIPEDGFVNGKSYSYSANDASVGDLNGDGQYEIILKWQPDNAKNPPQTGFTGKQLLDAYTLDGEFLWRIDLGKNIRAGAAYTTFLVYDFDGDGKSEMICKTADGTKDGEGNVIGDPSKDWRNHDRHSPMYGKIAKGPEYLTVFDGLTGKALDTKEYIPDRYPLNGWGGIGGNGRNDDTASRADRFSACVAYLDGIKPSAVMIRGWYGRTAVVAWDFDGKNLNQRWNFDSKNAENPYSGMANHNLAVADVDDDDKDEICVGAMTVDDDGSGLFTTGLRHGDAMHLTDLDPSNPGLEVFGIHENEGRTKSLQTPGAAQFDAATGEILWAKGPGVDVGRGTAADIDPRHAGYENWGGPGGLRDTKGNTISNKAPCSNNFLVWWDDDLTRELLDKNRIEKWNWEDQNCIPLLIAEGVLSNNFTKATPVLSGDILGDWREEVIWRSEDNKFLRIYTPTTLSYHRFYTLMHDPQYRLSIAWQNSAYNIPPQVGFYLGAETKEFPNPNIKIVQE